MTFIRKQWFAGPANISKAGAHDTTQTWNNTKGGSIQKRAA
jgi:hypothetical protein